MGQYPKDYQVKYLNPQGYLYTLKCYSVTSIFFFLYSQSLYRGLFPVLSSLYCSNFLYFYTFNGLKTVFVGRGKTSSSLQDLLFGYLAGNISLVEMLF